MSCLLNRPEVRGRHDALVRDLATLLRSSGFRNLRACIDGFREPEEIALPVAGEALTPDITATTASGTLEIFAVETPETVACATCNEAWSAFASYARAHDAAMWVVVPRDVRAEAVLRLHRMALRARVLGI